jgi:hypothetical protein
VIWLNKLIITTKARKVEELVASQVLYVEAIKLMGDDIFD